MVLADRLQQQEVASGVLLRPEWGKGDFTGGVIDG